MVGFVLLAGLFIACLVSCNLIFRKFFTWDLIGLTLSKVWDSFPTR